jgi:hypothetical protein
MPDRQRFGSLPGPKETSNGHRTHSHSFVPIGDLFWMTKILISLYRYLSQGQVGIADAEPPFTSWTACSSDIK